MTHRSGAFMSEMISAAIILCQSLSPYDSQKKMFELLYPPKCANAKLSLNGRIRNSLHAATIKNDIRRLQQSAAQILFNSLHERPGWRFHFPQLTINQHIWSFLKIVFTLPDEFNDIPSIRQGLRRAKLMRPNIKPRPNNYFSFLISHKSTSRPNRAPIIRPTYTDAVAG